MTGLETLQQWVKESNRIVFFGGEGVSTESGIPDFRSVDGLYHQKFEYPPETIISHSFYVKIRSISSGFTGRKCCLWGLSRTLPTKSLPSGSRRESSRLW